MFTIDASGFPAVAPVDAAVAQVTNDLITYLTSCQTADARVLVVGRAFIAADGGGVSSLAELLSALLPGIFSHQVSPVADEVLGQEIAAIVALNEQIPVDASPPAVADWWRRLSPQQQGILERDFADQLGGLNGVPAEVRDSANRQFLKADIAALVREEYELSHGGQLGSRLANVRAELATDLALQKQLDDNSGLHRYLLLFNHDGNNDGQVAIAIGNPDNATNVTTLVPGVGTTVASIVGKDGALGYVGLSDATNGANKSLSATIVWLGYNARRCRPGKSLVPPTLRPGRRLSSSFQAGLLTVNGDAHIVVEGHSYGSVVVAAAREPAGLSANDVILVGSPGVPATQATDFGVAPGYVFWGEMGGDPVPAASDAHHGDGGLGLGNDLKSAPGVIHFDAGNDFSAAPGATLGAGWGLALGVPGVIVGGVIGGIADHGLRPHSEYWNTGSVALENQAKVITGAGAQVTTVG